MCSALLCSALWISYKCVCMSPSRCVNVSTTRWCSSIARKLFTILSHINGAHYHHLNAHLSWVIFIVDGFAFSVNFLNILERTNIHTYIRCSVSHNHSQRRMLMRRTQCVVGFQSTSHSTSTICILFSPHFVSISRCCCCYFFSIKKLHIENEYIFTHMPNISRLQLCNSIKIKK